MTLKRWTELIEWDRPSRSLSIDLLRKSILYPLGYLGRCADWDRRGTIEERIVKLARAKKDVSQKVTSVVTRYGYTLYIFIIVPRLPLACHQY